MEKPLWQPSSQAVAKSNMMRFLLQVNANYSLQFKSYSELYQWSIQFPEKFWSTLWQFCAIKATKRWDKILVNADQMPGAKWFQGAELNFAENLLCRRDDKPALLFYGEKGTRRVISYHELYLEVAKLAGALRKAGVVAGDRIAGLLPNCPEAVIAMLATASIGAIWSSCSPDFGTSAVLDRFGQITPKIFFTVDGYYYNGKAYEITTKIENLQQQLNSIAQIIIVPFLQAKSTLTNHKNIKLYEDFLVKDSHIIQFSPLAFDHPLYIMYSSGTTGTPKCIVHSAGGTLLQHLKELVLHTDLTEADTIVYYTTCSWMMWNWLVSSLAVGATVVLYDGSPFHPKKTAFFDLIEQEKITVFGTSAKYISTAEKYNLKPIASHNLDSLRTILSTGSPLAPENFDYVYSNIKQDVCLSSISGGTDIISCFALGNPILPVYCGELQSRGLGMKVKVFNEEGTSIEKEKGELVCTAPFPSMPIYFWNDPDGKKYCDAYFAKYPHVWAHGDYAEVTAHDGMIIYGRSDATLKPHGIRIGTAEIYRQVEKIDEVIESIAVSQEWDHDTRIILFVKLREGITLNEDLKKRIVTNIHKNASPHHVPAKIIQVADIPKTRNGKLVELAVRNVIHGLPVKNIDVLANPEALEYFKNLSELKA